MAIQQINLGSAPSGAGGDTQRAANTKINQNFSNQAHAASRLVGVGEENLLEVAKTGINRTDTPVGVFFQNMGAYYTIAKTTPHLSRIAAGNETWLGFPRGVHFRATEDTSFALMASERSDRSNNRKLRAAIAWGLSTDSPESKNGEVLVQGINAFADGNGFWKTSSPVVRVYANGIDPNDDAEKQGLTFTRNGVGNYTLHNTLGLAQEGWQIELPQDNNRNPLVAIETEYTKDGDLIIRTYKRIFSMETFTFTCDYDNPLDIPEGRCVDVRLHEILPEVTDEPIE